MTPSPLAALVAGCLVSMAPMLAVAQTASYPSRPIRFVVPFPPGGGTDLIARTVGARLAEAWGQQVVVDNRPGAGTNIGNDIVAKAPGDGHTLLLASFALGVNQALYRRLSYDPLSDLAPVSLVAVAPNILVAHTAVPAANARELIALARAKPGAINYASFGSGTSGHLAAELFKQLAGVSMTHIPYKGGAQSITATISGETQVVFATMLSAVNHVKSGRLRGLGVTRDRRSPALPEVPTIAESGLPGYEFVNWYGIMVPAKTPGTIVQRLSDEVTRILKETEARERLTADGGEIVGSGPLAFAQFYRREVDKWNKVVRTAALQAD